MSRLINIKPVSPFLWRGQASAFLDDRVFNGRNLGLAQRSQARGIGLGVVPSQSNINTTKTTPADKRSRLRKGTI